MIRVGIHGGVRLDCKRDAVAQRRCRTAIGGAVPHGFTTIVGGFHIHDVILGIHLAHIVLHTHHRMIHGFHVMAHGRNVH